LRAALGLGLAEALLLGGLSFALRILEQTFLPMRAELRPSLASTPEAARITRLMFGNRWDGIGQARPIAHSYDNKKKGRIAPAPRLFR
jgi:hypothetical protein